MSNFLKSSGTGTTLLVCITAWLCPGAGHLIAGRVSKAVIFFMVLTLMFICGLLLDGELFGIDSSDPLVAMAAIADLGIGAPYFLARVFGAGNGNVVATTYEYGNSFLIVSGLLNMLVVIDVFDITKGRK